jgi:polyisoprenoid-binding protein YceI
MASKQKKLAFWGVGVLVVAIAAYFVLPWAYVKLFESNQETALTSDSSNTSVVTSGSVASIDGTWKVSTGKAQYQVHESLFGQSVTAVGSTTAVTGSATVSGASLTDTDVSVDVTKLSSDKTQRDGQVQNRILQTSTYPTAAFKLTSPIALGTEPAVGSTVTAKATGQLTLHGTTKTVTITLTVVRGSNEVKLTGSIPVTWTDYGISDPSWANQITVDPSGTLQFALTLTK